MCKSSHCEKPLLLTNFTQTFKTFNVKQANELAYFAQTGQLKTDVNVLRL